MGAERGDTDSNPQRVGTEPGLGKASPASAATAVTVEDDAPPPVDFDALHAALGDPLAYEESSSGPALEAGEKPAGEGSGNHGGGLSESSGRSSATYASARPRTIPPTRAPVEDPNAPAVIVASDTDTVPSAPPQMTMPLKAPPPPVPGGPRNAPGSNPHVQAAPGPYGVAGHPSSGPLAASQPFTPAPFPARSGPQMTMRMPDRPVLNPRRAKTPTVVMRIRGPSAKQKLVAFMAMLLLVTACGIAVIIWRKPRLLGLDPGGVPSASVSPAPGFGATSAPPSNTPTASTNVTASASGSAAPIAAGAAGAAGATAGGSASASAAAAASAKKPSKPIVAPVPPHPAASVLR